ncbi:FAD-dependent oxidoreductase [Microterricola pindariensis]|uniref:Pyridine nucleotide-disulfide oxidoreductase n=1 Tax=Microterricola pindariensis TaxID=478010 RepID=A0ABX5ATJ6_9MICO|nr:FAD-dependent oxidoreductase [Microterricola pindariensis]PPL16835.1 pyridine nucleotide-disulfide oxidoreductase [Microterricola pindariensis]
MITGEELRGIPIFAPLPPDTLDYVSRVVEDIRLLPGEYFVHEGEARALFVVIAGAIEITKVVSGEERPIGTRTPGQFFGEVPMTLSTNFPASGRAAGPARIIKLDVTAYYTLAAMAPSVPAKVAWLARRYLDAIQALAAEPPDVVARVIAPASDARARALSTFLTRNHVAFDRVTVEADAGEQPSPVLELRDGSRLTDPPLREVAGAVGLDVEPSAADYDVVILGGGPAGLTAAVNAAAEGLRTVVIERLAPGGQAGTSTRIENYTGFPFGISGDDLAGRALTQATRLGAELVVTRTATAVDPTTRLVTLDGGESVRAAALLIATGVEWRTLPVPGVERYLGNGVYYGAARSDAAVAQGQDVGIIGAGNSAGQAALFFARHARSVTMIVRGPALEASMSRYLIDQIRGVPGIRVETGSQAVGLHGDGALEAVDVLDSASATTSTRPLSVLFVMIGADAATDWLPPEIARDAHGFILTGADAGQAAEWPLERRPFALETSAPGVFAIGDVRSGSVKRVAAGVGEGGMAIAFTHQFLALDR